MTRLRAFAVLFAFVMLAAACGQKPGVHDEYIRSLAARGGGSDPGLGGVDPGVDGGVGGDDGGTTSNGGGGNGNGGGGNGGGNGSGNGGGNGGGGNGDIPTGGDSTGVSDDEIIIGIHAPVTGAAPIRSDSFNEGKDLYWNHGNNGNPVVIHGRRVTVKFENDEYNPSRAKSVCQTMAEGDKAFLLIGGGGTDQIRACADYARSRGIPYLSAGVVQDALENHENYFALSMSYPQQVPLLADYIRKNFTTDQSRIAMIVTDTANFDDATEAFQSEFPEATVIRPSKSDRGSNYNDDVCAGSQKRYDVVFPLTSPSFFLELEGSAACNPQYVGVGVTMGLDTVASVGCESPSGSMNGARFFSPFYAYVDAQRRNRDFIEAGGEDDIMFALWGISQVLHKIFDEVGENLTRERFIAIAERMQNIETGSYPTLSYTPDDHFGADEVHVLRADCSIDAYRTEAFFAKGF